MTKISVEVVRRDGLPYREGNAIVKRDGVVIANLRSGESAEFTVHPPEVSSHVDQPLGLNKCSCGDGSAEDDRGAVLRCPVHGIGPAPFTSTQRGDDG